MGALIPSLEVISSYMLYNNLQYKTMTLYNAKIEIKFDNNILIIEFPAHHDYKGYIRYSVKYDYDNKELLNRIDMSAHIHITEGDECSVLLVEDILLELAKMLYTRRKRNFTLITRLAEEVGTDMIITDRNLFDWETYYEEVWRGRHFSRLIITDGEWHGIIEYVDDEYFYACPPLEEFTYDVILVNDYFLRKHWNEIKTGNDLELTDFILRPGFEACGEEKNIIRCIG